MKGYVRKTLIGLLFWSSLASASWGQWSSSDRFRGLLERLDRNGDGTLAPDEVPPQMKPFVARMAERAGQDPARPLKIADLAPQRQATQESNSSRSAPVVMPLVPGFGVPREEATEVPGFGVLPSSKSSVPLEKRFDRRVLDYVDGILRQYDANGNSILEQPEWKEVPWQSSPQASDLNRDGRLTREELCERIANRWGRGRLDPSAGKSSSSRSQDGRDREGDRRESNRLFSSRSVSKDPFAERKSYRLVTPTERLPKGLPDWFIRNDLNEDGQIMMREFATVWTEERVRDFIRYDQNDDGVITPDECLEAEAEEEAD